LTVKLQKIFVILVSYSSLEDADWRLRKVGGQGVLMEGK